MRNSCILIAALSGCVWISDEEDTLRRDQDQDDVLGKDDCDDRDPDVLDTRWYVDLDQDGYGTGEGLKSCEEQEGLASEGGDCDDNDDTIYPGAAELCNELDDDCDEEIDEGIEDQQWFLDNDGDGYGVTEDYIWEDSCEEVDQHSRVGGDCDDFNFDIYPGAEERCDPEDSDCDGEGFDPESVDAPYWHSDVDGDGWGDPDSGTTACEQPSGLIANGSDCNDTDPNISPMGQEVCDEDNADEDCDGTVDDDDDTVDPSTFRALYLDADRDGYGSTITQGCDPEDGYSDVGEDCNDSDPAVNPGADEVCDEFEQDEDCDGLANDADDNLLLSSAPTWHPDEDGDGYGDLFDPGTASCEPSTGFPVDDNTDCDDTRFDVNPEGIEVCDLDDVDEDCDGLVDSNDPSVDPTTHTTWYQDVDGDGYGTASGNFVIDCDPPTGFGQGTDDCDDTDASISPGAQEIWYDGIDQDCDNQNDYDADLDGYESDQYGGTDCDDASSATNPGSPEICNDGLDNDCEPSTDTQCGLQSEISVNSAEAEFLQEGSGDGEAGASVDAGTDLNGDGFDDLLIGSPGYGSGFGAAYVFLGPVSGSINLGNADLRILGAGNGDSAGSTVAFLGDVTGDGVPDIAVGAYGRSVVATESGSAYVVSGAASGNMTLSNQSSAQIHGAAIQEQLGYSLSSAGDFDSDGNDDWAVGAPGSGSGASGNVYVLQGPVTGTYDTSMASVNIVGEDANDEAGLAISGGTDVTGDGFSDLLIGAPSYDKSGVDLDSGRAYIVEGGGLQVPSISLGDGFIHALTGETARDEAGISVAFAGDSNGDGSQDVLVGAYLDDDGVLNAGAAYLILGPINGDMDLANNDAKLTGGSVSGHLGVSVSGAGDVNADGFDDLLVGAEQEDLGGAQSGVVYVVLGPVTGGGCLNRVGPGCEGLGSGKPRIYGQANEMLGHSISGAGDVNADGFSDILLGTDGHGAYLLLGGDR